MLSFRSVPARQVIENSNKIAKKLKNIDAASFQAKIGWKRLKKKENKNYRSFFSHPTRNIKFQKNSKKLRNTIMAKFQAKIGWKRLGKSENKNYHSVSFQLEPL